MSLTDRQTLFDRNQQLHTQHMDNKEPPRAVCYALCATLTLHKTVLP